ARQLGHERQRIKAGAGGVGRQQPCEGLAQGGRLPVRAQAAQGLALQVGRRFLKQTGKGLVAEVHVQALVEGHQWLVHGTLHGLQKIGRALQPHLLVFKPRNARKRDDGPADVVVEGAVGQNTHRVPLVAGALDVELHGGKAKNKRNVGGIEQVFHIVGRLVRLLRFGLVLHVEGHQLLVEALHFLFVGHGFLVGALQLLVGALQFLVGAFQLLQAAFHLLNNSLEPVLGKLQLLVERRDSGFVLAVGLGAAAAGAAHAARRGLAVVGLHGHVFHHHVFVGLGGAVHGSAHLVGQLFAGHLKQVHAAEAGRGLKVLAGAAVHVQDFAFGINHHRRRGVAAQQLFLHQRGKGAALAAQHDR
nr:hypothetical protein [Tanacetum cinerariifolium]